MVIIKFLTRYDRNTPFKYGAKSYIKSVEYFKTLRRRQFVITNHLRAYAENKGEDLKSKKAAEKKPLKMPGLVHPETLNEEVYYSEKTKAQLQQIKRKPDSINIDSSKDKREK